MCESWRLQEPDPVYDPEVLAGSADDADDAGGEFAWLAKVAEDELTPRAAELVMLTGKASTSMMQTKLKVGFNRASRLMEELERFGIVGPQDPRNPATPRQVYGPELAPDHGGRRRPIARVPSTVALVGVPHDPRRGRPGRGESTRLPQGRS